MTGLSWLIKWAQSPLSEIVFSNPDIFNRASFIIINNAIILNIMHNIFNLRDTCICFDVSADKINITDVSSCLIANCSNNAATSNSYYINCNETADGFFCLQGILANIKGDNLDFHIHFLHRGLLRFVFMSRLLLKKNTREESQMSNFHTTLFLQNSFVLVSWPYSP